MQTPSLCLASFHYLRTVWQLKVSKTHAWSLRRMASFNPWELRDKHGDREWRTSGENFGFHCLLVLIVQRHWVYGNGTERMQHFLSAALTNGVFLTAFSWSWLRQLYKLNYLVLCIQNLLRHNGPRDFLCFSSKLSTPRNTVLMISVASNQMTDCMLIGMTFKVESVSN